MSKKDNSSKKDNPSKKDSWSRKGTVVAVVVNLARSADHHIYISIQLSLENDERKERYGEKRDMGGKRYEYAYP